MNKKSYYILAGLGTLVFGVSFFVNKGVVEVLLGILVLATWLIPLMFRSDKLEVKGEEEEEIETVKSPIPGYEKSHEKIKGCYNCYYSQDVGNRTFVFCSKFQRKVYRDHICDIYKV